jgi:hypothetical protein
MRMWPISPRVNKPENDDAAIIEPIEAAIDAASCGKALSPPGRRL